MDNPFLVSGALGVGVLIGAGIAWLYFRFYRSKLDAELAVLQERLSARETRSVTLEGELARERLSREQLLAKFTQAETQLEAERASANEKLAAFEEARRGLLEQFKALSLDALRANNQSFVELAKTTLEKVHETAKGDLEKKEQAIAAIVKPVRESLDKVDGKIQEIEKTRAGAYEGLTKQVEMLMDIQRELRGETGNLVRALRTPVVRGRWGELQLKRVVEMAGMLEHCDFDQQQTVVSEEGRLRPDLVVRLPGGRQIIVDAKAPLEAFLAAMEAQNDEVRRTKIGDHARQIRSHITSLGRKSYWEQFSPAPEFVILFLPGENFFSAALENDPSLIEAGITEKVLLATPTTLIALLRAVAYGWKQERLAENAQQISELGRDLYKRLSDMAEHWSRVGKSLGNAIESYNKAVGSLESRVLTSARRFRELQAGADSIEIEQLEPLDHLPRVLQAPEYTSPELFGK